MTPTKTSTPHATGKRSPRVIEGTKAPAIDEGRREMLANYEAAIRLMQEGKFERAHVAFDKMLAAGPGDLGDRIRMYISACLQQATKAKRSFANPEEQYDYAISLLNGGHYDDAREHLQSIVAKDTKADYAFYGLAVLASLTSESHTCLEHLTEAIRQNPRNRIQARADSDFQNMADDPRFTELLYPES